MSKHWRNISDLRNAYNFEMERSIVFPANMTFEDYTKMFSNFMGEYFNGVTIIDDERQIK